MDTNTAKVLDRIFERQQEEGMVSLEDLLKDEKLKDIPNVDKIVIQLLRESMATEPMGGYLRALQQSEKTGFDPEQLDWGKPKIPTTKKRDPMTGQVIPPTPYWLCTQTTEPTYKDIIAKVMEAKNAGGHKVQIASQNPVLGNVYFDYWMMLGGIGRRPAKREDTIALARKYLDEKRTKEVQVAPKAAPKPPPVKQGPVPDEITAEEFANLPEGET